MALMPNELVAKLGEIEAYGSQGWYWESETSLLNPPKDIIAAVQAARLEIALELREWAGCPQVRECMVCESWKHAAREIESAVKKEL